MKKIGMLTIGQAPRDDILPGLMDVMGDNYEFVQAGALDEKSLDDVRSIRFPRDSPILVTRMRDGTEVKVTKKFVIPLMQKRLKELEDRGIRLTVVMCTGRFPQFTSRSLVVTPREVIRGVLNATLKQGKLGVIYPAEEQVDMAEEEFGSPEVEIYADWLSPYREGGELKPLVRRLSQESPDLILLNCFGFNSDIKEAIYRGTGIPPIQSNSLIARVLKELA
ncbi:MAG: AroM family protein [Candidatus Bathyarchaeia archaeon]